MDTAFTNIYQYIKDDVKRPDLWEEVLRRIARSILRLHRLDIFKKDMREQIYYFDNANTAAPVTYPAVTGGLSLFMNNIVAPNTNINVQVVDLAKLTGIRKIHYIRKFVLVDNFGNPVIDPTTGLWGTVQGGDLQEVSPDSMFDGYGYDKRNCWYLSGNDVKITSDTPFGRVFIGYIKDPITVLDVSNQPNTTPASNLSQTDSWIARDYPSLVAADVKKRVFGDIGKPDEARMSDADYKEELMTIFAHNIKFGTR